MENSTENIDFKNCHLSIELTDIEAIASDPLYEDKSNKTGSSKVKVNAITKLICKTIKIQYYHIRQFYITIIIAFVSSRVGFTSAFTSPAEEGLEKEFGITRYQYSWLGSLMPCIALIGGIVGGVLISKKGRRYTIITANTLFGISWMLLAIAQNIWWVYIGRSIVGIGVGITSLVLPVYLAEILEAEFRGKFGLFPTAFGNGGILLCFILGSYFKWRMLAIFGVLCSIPFLVFTYKYLPETPTWFMSINNEEDAENVLIDIRQNKDVSDELYKLKDTIKDIEETEQSNFKDIFKPEYRRAISISVVLMLFQQLSGINAIIYYSNNIFTLANSSIDEKYCTIIIGIVNFISAFVASSLIDKLGRKLLLYISGITLVITLNIIWIYFYFMKSLSVSYGWIPLISLVIYILGFSLGFGPIPWLMMGEILPRKIRASAAALSTSCNWFFTFLVTKIFYTTTDVLHLPEWVIFFFFSIVCAISLIYIKFQVPETSGKTLEEIEQELIKT